MASASVSLFINPTAGRGKTGRRLGRIESIFDCAGIEYRLYSSRDVGDLEQLVCDCLARDSGDIVVAGGDGSIHEAVNGIMGAKNPARLGVIPTGTGNDFAKACGLSLDWELTATELAARIANGTSGRSIDIARMNDRWFANGAGVGFDAKVTKVARAFRWPIGDLVYLVAIFRCMVDGIATPEITITSDTLQWRGPVTLANISNGPWVGGMFHIAPMAKNDDGRLELVIADPVSRLRILALLPKLIRGVHVSAPEITHAGVRRLTIESPEALPSHLDGEVQPPAKRFEIELMSRGLQII
jgi:diacylglycerol kinase (ATP)